MTKRIAHFGAFDHDSYGDLLFPWITEHFLGSEYEVIHVAPSNTPTPWPDAKTCISVQQAMKRNDWDGILVGGGDIIQAGGDWNPQKWQTDSVLALTAMPSLWIGASFLAAKLNIPLAWNAPGVPVQPKPEFIQAIRLALRAADYISVRDHRSKEILAAHTIANIQVIPDSAVMIDDLWPKPRSIERSSPFCIAPSLADLQTRSQDISAALTILREQDASGTMISALPLMAWERDDHAFHRIIASLGKDIDIRPRSITLQSCAHVLAGSRGYIGNSLHGFITASSYGVPAVLVIPSNVSTPQKHIGFIIATGQNPSHYVTDSWRAAVTLLGKHHKLESRRHIRDEQYRHWQTIKQALQALPNPKVPVWEEIVAENAAQGMTTTLLGVLPNTLLGKYCQTRSLCNELSRQNDVHEQYSVAQGIQIAELNKSIVDRDAQIAGLHQVIADHDTRIIDLSQTVANRAAQIADLHQAVADRDTRIGGLSQTVANRDAQIADLHQAIADRDTRIGGLKQTIANCDEQITVLNRTVVDHKEQIIHNRTNITRLEAELFRLSTVLHNTVNSRSWLLTRPYRLAGTLAKAVYNFTLVYCSGLFDPEYYLHNNPDVARAGVPALWHFMRHGAKEGRNPSPLFDISFYLRTNPDVAAVGINPLVHYLRFGKKEGRQPLPQPATEPANKRDTIRRSEAPALIPEDIRVQCSDQPTVSVIIPVHNQIDLALQCLASLASVSDKTTKEVIVIDDASTDRTATRLTAVGGIRYIRNEHNHGFLRTCNKAASRAKGNFILLLNSDTTVAPDAIDALVSVMSSRPDAGAVGSKLVFPDGTLQEAGGIIWRDASAWNYGRGADPSLPEYNYVKEVDYCSGASLLVRRSAFETIGGFDEAYAPAYCEDSDLCFKLRESGMKVYYQPLSVVVHQEGASCGRDTTQGIKSCQIRNQERLRKKWASVLEHQHATEGSNTFLARDRSSQRPCILVIDHYTPHYDRDAGSRTVFAHLTFFVRQGFNVKFIGDNFCAIQPYISTLQQMGIEVLDGPWYANHWNDWLRDNGSYIHYVLVNRPHIAAKYIEAVRKHSSAKLLFYGHDIHFLRFQREYECAQRAHLLKVIEEYRALELCIWNKVDVVYYPSPVERDIVKRLAPNATARVLPPYVYEDRHINAPPADSPQRHGLLFVGGFAHSPNEDGILWFCLKILPLVRTRLQDIVLTIAGSNPSPAILKLECPHIRVLGTVTDQQLASCYHTARIVVVPLRFGAGIKGKVVESMYYGTPIVTTSVGAEGLRNADGAVLLADTPEMFAQEVIRLYDNKELALSLAHAGQSYVQTHFSPANLAATFAEDIRSLALTATNGVPVA